MELLLNLLWLLLALTAIAMWRRERASGPGSRGFDPLRSVLLLGCALLLLFPVVSATDDLHAMRPESEESNPSKHTVKYFGGDKTPSRTGGFGASPALLISLAWFCPSSEACAQVLAQYPLQPELAPLGVPAGRAPAVLLLGS
jgi:hypothetical protein